MNRRGRTPPAASTVRVKRAYEPAGRADGHRVLVDRLWPRGVTKKRLALAVWCKDLAPSDALRRWFAHDPRRWKEFVARYRDELRSAEAAALLDDLVERAKSGNVTLVYAARDTEHNEALVLRDMVARRLKRGKRPPARPR